jgi:hypothetical protein
MSGGDLQLYQCSSATRYRLTRGAITAMNPTIDGFLLGVGREMGTYITELTHSTFVPSRMHTILPQIPLMVGFPVDLNWTPSGNEICLM